MLRTIKIGETDIEMLSNAATPYRYMQCFHEDLILKMAKGLDETEAVGIFQKLGYVMAAQAEKKDLTKLSEEDFYVWLEQFDYLDLMEAEADIAELYTASKKGTVSPK